MKLITLIFLLVLSGCAGNPYSNFYHDATGGRGVELLPNAIIPLEDPKLYNGVDVETDNQRLLEEGYILIGVSYFNSGELNQGLAVRHGKDVKAAVIYLYEEYTHTQSGTFALTLPDTQTSTTNFSGNAYGSGGYSNFSGTGTTTTYGTKTTNIPYSVNRFDYIATYWVKAKPSALGIFAVELEDAQRQMIESNKGVLITAVVKGSPAYQADLLKGDILRQIEGIEITDTGSMRDAINELAGKSVAFLVYRNGKQFEAIVDLGLAPN